MKKLVRIVVALICSMLLAIIQYRIETIHFKKAIEEKLIITASAIKYILPSGYHDKIREKDSILNPEFEQITKRLNRFSGDMGVAYTYSFLQKEENYYITSSNIKLTDRVIKGNEIFFFQEYSEMNTILNNYIKLEDKFIIDHTDRWGSFRSIFIPFKNKEGNQFYYAAGFPLTGIKNHETTVAARSAGLGIFVFISILILIYLRSENNPHRPLIIKISAFVFATSICFFIGYKFHSDMKTSYLRDTDENLLSGALSLHSIFTEELYNDDIIMNRNNSQIYEKSQVLESYRKDIHFKNLYRLMIRNDKIFYNSGADLLNLNSTLEKEILDKVVFFKPFYLKSKTDSGVQYTVIIPERNETENLYTLGAEIDYLKIENEIKIIIIYSVIHAGIIFIIAYPLIIILFYYGYLKIIKKINIFKSIKTRLVFSVSLVVSVSFFVISYFFVRYSEDLLKNKTLDVCRNFAFGIVSVAREDLVLDSTYELTRGVIEKVATSGVEGLDDIYLMNVYGRYVVNYSGEEIGKFASSLEIQNVQEIKNVELKDFYSNKKYKEIIRIYFPIFINYEGRDLKIGAAIFEYDKSRIYESVREMQQRMYLAGLLMILITLLTTFYISVRTTNPILELSQAVKKISEGNLQYEIHINSNDEIGLLADTFNDMTSKIREHTSNLEELVKNRTIELTKRTRELDHTLNLIRQDLVLAKKIQLNAMAINSSLIDELEIVSRYLPMSEVGGDFYSINKVNDHVYRFFLADATGHGIQAALITMAIKGIYDNLKFFELKTDHIMQIFNNEFIDKYSSLDSLMTSILVDIDISAKKITYVSAGHPPMVLLKKGKSFLLEKTGRMIGIKKSDHYESKNIDFVPGDRLYLFTDGLVEEFDSNEEQFEEDKLYKILENNYKINLGDSIVKVLEQLDEFLDGQERQDDITILGIYFKS